MRNARKDSRNSGLSSFLSKIGILREPSPNSKRQGPQDLKHGPWMHDSAVTACFECNVEFSLFTRRHHCRSCGRIFCDKCSQRRVMLDSQLQRVCEHCFDQRVLHSSETTFSAILHASPDLETLSAEHVEVDRACARAECTESRSPSTKGEIGLSQHISNAHENDYHDDSIEDHYSKKYVLFGNNVPFEDFSRLSNVVGEKSCADSNNRARIHLTTTYEHLEDQINLKHIDESGIADSDWWKSTTEPTVEGVPGEQNTDLGMDCNSCIQEAADIHFQALNSFLVRSECLGDEWMDLIPSLAKQAYNSINFISHSRQDFNRAIKVKKVQGGEPADSVHIRGVVFTRNVVHKRMRTCIKEPKMMLLACAVEYDRDNKFSSLVNLASQEREYLRIAVNKIVSYLPDVILVEKSVAGVAQQMFLEANVTVVVNVKRSVLERISEFTGADIVPSIEFLGALKQQSKGRSDPETPCRKLDSMQFRCLMQIGQDKPLVFVESCDSLPKTPLCTIIIRGKSLKSLGKVKAALLFSVYAFHCISSELSFIVSCGGVLSNGYRAISTGTSIHSVIDDCLTGKDGNSLSEISLGRESLDKNTDCRDCSRNGLDGNEILGENDVQESPQQPMVFTLETVAQEATPVQGIMDSSIFRVLNLSPFFSFEMPSECSRFLHRVLHQVRTTKMLHKLTDASDSFMKENSVDSESSSNFDTPRSSLNKAELYEHFSIMNISERATSKSHHRLSMLSAEKTLELAPSPGMLWVPPDSSLDSATLGTIRVLASSALPSFDSASCIEPSELWIRFNADGDASLAEYLESYCFNARAMCPSKACGFPMIDHEHAFVHGASRVRIRVSQRSCNSSAVSSDIVHRMRCVSCARMTSSGRVLSKDAMRLSFGRFLELLLYERKLRTGDPSCPHPFHQQLHSFSRGNLTALFVSEPITLFEIVLPSLRMERVSSDYFARLGLLEFSELESSIEKLQSLISYAGQESFRALQCQLDGLLQSLRKLEFEEAVSLDAAESYRRTLLPIAMKVIEGLCFCGIQVDATPPCFGNEVLDKDAVVLAPEVGSRIFRRSHDSEVWAGFSQVDSQDPNSRDTGILDDFDIESGEIRSCSPDNSMSQEHHIRYHTASTSSQQSTISRFLGSSLTKKNPRVSQEYVQSVLEDSLVTMTIGHCCHVHLSPYLSSKSIHCDLNSTTCTTVYEDELSSIIACALSSSAYLQAVSMEESSEDHEVNAKELPIDEIREKQHLKISFESDGLSGKVQFNCKVYLAREFEDFRGRYCQGDHKSFVKALSRCKKWVPTGGKSSAGFTKTYDERFILKEITKRELRHFLSSAEAYFDYMKRTLGPSRPQEKGSPTQALPSCLVKICGIFKSEWKHVRSGRSSLQIVIVMENLWYIGGRLDHPVTRIFDLKGSARNRFVKEAKDGEVQLDDNFHDYLQRSPLFLSERCKRQLNASIFNDTVFLTSINVMDYSLLVGIDESSHRIAVGIIDYMRPYTMDKQAEFYYKSAIDRVALKSTCEAPTVLPPPEYKQRFRQAMARDFLASPSKLTAVRQSRTF